MELGKVEAALCRFYECGLASSTRKSYSSGQKRFLSFCKEFQFSPIPPSEHTIMLFISKLGMDGLAMATIKSNLSSIRQLLIDAGISSPVIYTPRVELVIRGIKRAKVGLSDGKDSRLSITHSILDHLKRI